MTRGLAVLCLAVYSALPGREAAAGGETPPVCEEQIAGFAEARRIALDPNLLEFGERWTGAGHEVQRLPGYSVRIPLEDCAGALLLDLSEACEPVKSRGEGACRAAYPPAFY